MAPRGRANGPRHLSWVWQFSRDGPPEQVVSLLAQHNLGVLMKSHDGTDWMSRYDASPYAVSGPDQLAVLAAYFETYGVPFHTWSVVKGVDPKLEAELCAQDIAAGARSVTVDLEPHAGFWSGTPEDAGTFGREFRQRQPAAILYVSVDPRPWVLTRVPVAEFASFAQGFVPQVYWETFNSPENRRRFQESGFPPPEQGVTPEFLLDVARTVLAPYRLPVLPAGQGASTNMDAWRGFMGRATALSMTPVSVWRHGVTGNDVWELLSGVAPSPALAIGVTARVANTGSCLNVREAPRTAAAVRACLLDGTTVVVRDGPVDADGYRWWFIEAQTASGWSAEGAGGVLWLVPAG